MANLNAKININNVFALSNYTNGEGYFFTTLKDAIEKRKTFKEGWNTDDEVVIVELKLRDSEFIPVRIHEKDGTLVDLNEKS